jgi:dipeptidyl aminopeptidase/acylaminoacyl peptidase
MLVPFDGSDAPRPLTSGRHRDSAPRWSPDSRSLAFVSDRDNDSCQLFLLSLAGGEPCQLTSLKRGAGTPVWSPSGDRIAFSARVDIEAIAGQEGESDERGKPPRARIITRVRYKADGEGFLEASHRHLLVLDIQHSSATPRQITDGDFDDADPCWSPDGSLIAFTSNRERDRDLSLLSDVWIVPSAGGRARRLTRHKGQAGQPAFSPDGTRVVFLGHERGWEYGVNTGLLHATIQAAEVTSLSGDTPHELENSANSDVRDPAAPSAPSYTSDGRGILTLASCAGSVEILKYSRDGGQPEFVLGGPEREVAAFSTAGDRLVALISDPTHPYEIVAIDHGQERRLTHENDALLEALALSPAEPFAVTSTDGESVHGWVIKPVGFSERKQWPLILEVHGGPETMYAATFMHEFQVLAGRGYAVVFTNPRGSKGYGEAFTARIFADWGNQDAADCMAAVDAAADWTWVDSARLGVTGGSYGGFMTSWLLGHTRRFKAAVAQRGLYNFVSFYGTSDIGQWFGDYVMGGPVYERDELYRERSPITYAAEMRTPLLLLHSESDLRCPIEQAEQLFVRLRRLGKTEVEMVRFPDESHNLSRSGRPDRRVERLERIVGWFDTHL